MKIVHAITLGSHALFHYGVSLPNFSSEKATATTDCYFLGDLQHTGQMKVPFYGTILINMLPSNK